MIITEKNEDGDGKISANDLMIVVNNIMRREL